METLSTIRMYTKYHLRDRRRTIKSSTLSPYPVRSNCHAIHSPPSLVAFLYVTLLCVAPKGKYHFRFLTIVNSDKKVWMDRSSSDNSNDAVPLVDGAVFMKANRLFITNQQNGTSSSSSTYRSNNNNIRTEAPSSKQNNNIAVDRTINSSSSFQSPEKLLKFESEDDFDKVSNKVNATNIGTSNGNNDLLGFDLDAKDTTTTTTNKSSSSSNMDLFGLETLQPTPILQPSVNNNMNNSKSASFTRSNNSFDAFSNLGNFK